MNTRPTRAIRRGGWVVLAALAAVVAFAPNSQTAHAVATTAGARVPAADAPSPKVMVDPPIAKAGTTVQVTVEGFDVPYVTVSVCGNNALRGSTDCNMLASKGFELKKNGEPTWTEFMVTKPPVPCPCVIRVSSTSNNSVATVPLKLLGHASAPVKSPGDPGQPLVEVTVEGERASSGLMRSIRANLGGAATYEVTVAVRNLTTDTLRKVILVGAAGRDRANLTTSFELENPGELAAGEVVTQSVLVELPAPTVGTFVLSVTASGAGPIVTSTRSLRATPWLLVLLVGLFVLDIGLLIIRRLMSRRAHREAKAAADAAALAASAAASASASAPVIDVETDPMLIDA